MNGALAKLLQIGSPALAPATAELALSEQLRQRAGRLAVELEQLLLARNGWYAFDSALHVFPGAGSASERGLVQWNDGALWAGEYRDLAEGCLFFAEDAFGNQFCVKDDQVWAYDAETGSREPLGDSLEAWAARVLAETALLTGHPFAAAWQQQHGALAAGQRLCPRRPFVLGGAFEIDNLYALDAVTGMRFRACVAVQIRDLPDGTEVEIKVAP